MDLENVLQEFKATGQLKAVIDSGVDGTIMYVDECRKSKDKSVKREYVILKLLAKEGVFVALGDHRYTLFKTTKEGLERLKNCYWLTLYLMFFI